MNIDTKRLNNFKRAWQHYTSNIDRCIELAEIISTTSSHDAELQELTDIMELPYVFLDRYKSLKE